MRSNTSLRAAILWCEAPVVLLIGIQLVTRQLPYLQRLTLVSALAGLSAWGMQERVRTATPTDGWRWPGWPGVGLCLLASVGLWLLAAWIELSRYFGYPIVPVPEAYLLTPERVVWLLVGLAFLAPLAAEAFFRGVILPACAPFGQRTALVLSSLSFAVYYLGCVRLFSPVPVVLLGLTLGYVAGRTQSLLASTLIHSSFHTLTLGVFLINAWHPAWAADLPLTSVWTGMAGALTLGTALWLLPAAMHLAPVTLLTQAQPIQRVRRHSTILITVLTAAAAWISVAPPPAATPVLPLTSQQKEAEFRYLTRLIRDTYAVSDSIAAVKDLANPVDLEAEYIRRAAASRDDWEYYQVFRKYLVALSQGGHATLISPERARYYATWYVSYDYGLYPALLSRASYWWDMETRLETSWYAYSGLSLLYQNGQYVLAQPAVVDGQALAPGTRITGVEGLSVDDYVRQQSARERLQYDPAYHRLSLRWAYERLLLVDPGPNHAGWQIEFQLPDGSRFRGMVPKRPGRNWAPYNQPHPNVVAVELDRQVGYLRLFSFNFQPGDHERIQAFMQASGGRYRKLIIDVRGNGGGDPRYWMDSLVAPLLEQPLRYDLLSAVRRSVFNRLNIRVWLHRVGGLGMFAANEHFGGLTEVAPPVGYDPRQWRAFWMARAIEPADAFPFDGQVYVLIDDLCASACEDFVLALKITGLARLVGTQTFGCAPGVFPQMPYTLPESGLTFWIEANLVFNPDGTVNQVYGTAPDVHLSATLPPADYSPAVLLADPWIQWVMQDTPGPGSVEP